MPPPAAATAADASPAMRRRPPSVLLLWLLACACLSLGFGRARAQGSTGAGGSVAPAALSSTPQLSSTGPAAPFQLVATLLTSEGWSPRAGASAAVLHGHIVLACGVVGAAYHSNEVSIHTRWHSCRNRPPPCPRPRLSSHLRRSCVCACCCCRCIPLTALCGPITGKVPLTSARAQV